MPLKDLFGFIILVQIYQLKADNCDTKTTEADCFAQELYCSFLKDKCTEITDLALVKCTNDINKKTCAMVKNDSCKINDQDRCAQFNISSDICEQAYNQYACLSDFPDGKQCQWNDSKCKDYLPTKCEGDQDKIRKSILKLTKKSCDDIEKACTWNNDECKPLDLEKDQCTSNLNEQACFDIPLLCSWTDDKCQEYILDDSQPGKDCKDKRNKAGCRQSNFPCAWDNKECVQFNNYTHNCEDSVSLKACRGVPFPCGWNSTAIECKWYDDALFGCSGAINQIACLVSDVGCVWKQDENEEFGTCLEDDKFFLDEDAFWETWDEDAFYEEFTKKFFQLQKEELAKLNGSSEEETQVENQPTESNNDQGSTKLSIAFLYVLLVCLT